MTRTSDDWREAAEYAVVETIEHTGRARREVNDTVLDVQNQIAHSLLESDDDRTDRREVVRDAERALVDAARELLDAAYDVRKLRSGSALRNLDGEEPLGYSKPDYGVTADAHYGSKSMSAEFARKITWPLDLSEWDKEQGGRPRGPNAELETVSAEGVEKFTRYAGGRTVSLVLGERDPPV